MASFLSGMITAGFLVAALFFLRFWSRTRDSLFATFGIAFLLFAIGQTLSVTFDFLQDDKTLVFVMRLLGFGLLLVAIARKNLQKQKP
jgi:Kef-type K+ transport system membrane component KefB